MSEKKKTGRIYYTGHFMMVLKHYLLSLTDISNNVIIAAESSFCRHQEVFLSLNDYSLVTCFCTFK